MELVLIRPLYQRHIEQVLVTVGLGLAFVALVQRHLGPDAQPYPCRPGSRDHDDRRRAHSRTTAGSRSSPRRLVLALLQLFLRQTRYGLIIRAGVENRAMVTALGIDVRKAFTLVFAIGGVAAGDRRRAQRRLLHVDRPEPGDEPADLRVHRRRDRRPRLDRRLGGRRRRRRSAPAVRQLLRPSGIGDIAVVLLLGLVLLARPRGLAGAVAT